MLKRIIITFLLTLLANSPLFAKTVNYSIGAMAGFAPSLGGNLDSDLQRNYFGSDDGIDGMNRSMDGEDTTNIHRITGFTVGAEFKTIIKDFFLIRIGANYTRDIFGGEGTTVIDDGGYYPLECKYIFWEFDAPVTVGLAIPFWKDVMFSISCGIAYARADYKYKFESDDPNPTPFVREGHFSGWALPLVVLIQGEYFFLTNASLTSTIAYYNGSTKILKDSEDTDTAGFGGVGAVDYSKINLTGYRFSFGISYYFYSI